VRCSAASALMSVALLASAVLGLDAEGSSAAAAQAGSGTASAPSWTIGIAQFSSTEESGASTILLSALPRLIVANLQSLPTRRTPPDEAEQAAVLKVARARFAAGTDLAEKLDERATGFLDPSIAGAEKRYYLHSADKAVRDSAKKLDDLLKAEKTGGEKEPEAAGQDLTVKLWEGHAKGKLVDPPGADLAKAAKAAELNFLVVGTVSLLESGYATVVVRGYDALLGREVFSWKSYCATDDPEPLARDMAQRIERWCAGRDFARIEIKPDPAGVELFVNGTELPGISRIAYLYEPGPVHISAYASGYGTGSIDMLVALGERRTADIELSPLSTGSVALDTDPTGASISLDSVPIGATPLSIGLDGTRKVVIASAEDMETKTVVLPASGESSLNLKLQPSDGIGPSGRIAAAKDDFYWSFGWFAVSIPISTLTLGVYNVYDEAYQRSGSPSLAYSRWTASRAFAAACALTATTAVFMVIRLVKYLKATR
jgi:hypothetical protein